MMRFLADNKKLKELITVRDADRLKSYEAYIAARCLECSDLTASAMTVCDRKKNKSRIIFSSLEKIEVNK